MKRLRQMLKTTAVRLTLLYSLLFGVLSFALVLYVGYNTGSLLISQIRSAAEEEVRELETVYQRGGARSLIRSIERRSRNPSSNLYLLSDPSGRIIVGNVKNVDPTHLTKGGWSAIPFPYQRFGGAETDEHKAIAQVFGLPNGLKLLVGRDVGDANQFRGIIRRALSLALLAMLAMGLLLWFVIGRRALQRIDRVSQSSARIVAGDLSERLPIAGTDDEFDRLSNNLNGMIARVESLNDGIRNMSDSIAHDLKTPLTRLRAQADVALNTPRSGKKQQSEALQNIAAEADGLIKTFDALLMISQVSSGARSVEMSPVNLGALLADIHELFEPSAESEGVTFDLALSHQPTINANRELVAQALTNILDNALKYGCEAKEPRIAIRLLEVSGEATIEVSDNGDGIPDDRRADVLERFVRLDESRSKSGSGLGLALVDAVVKLHGGRVVLGDNEPGLSVKIVFPTPG